MRLVPLALLALLVGCASTSSPASSPDLTRVGSVLSYEVTAGSQAYPFVVAVTENGAEGTAFAYDLGGGAQVGTVRMTAAARERAPGGMLNAFGTQDYDLDDQTSVWMARDDVRRLAAGESVAIDLGGGATTFELDACDVPFSAGERMLQTCRYTADGGAFIVALDNAAEPLIVDMDTGRFRVTLQGVGG